MPDSSAYRFLGKTVEDQKEMAGKTSFQRRAFGKSPDKYKYRHRTGLKGFLPLPVFEFPQPQTV
jgi:hypothetical protein